MQSIIFMGEMWPRCVVDGLVEILSLLCKSWSVSECFWVCVFAHCFLRLISSSFAFNFLVSMTTHPTCLRLLKQSKPNLGVFPSGLDTCVKYTPAQSALTYVSVKPAASVTGGYNQSWAQTHSAWMLEMPDLLHIKCHPYC